eukprot:scaffold319185_cov59-Attheya_sp.AAC.1
MGEENMSKKDAHIIGCGGKTGEWLTVLPNVMNGSILSDLKFRDGLGLCYAMTLQNLPTHCDSCNAKCNIDHALNYKKGGLVVKRHNEVKDELGFLATLATLPNAVRDKPFIFPGCAANCEGNCEFNSCLHVQSSTNNEGDRRAIYYFTEFGNDKHTVLWTFISQMFLIRDLISHQHQRRLMGREATALVKRLA